MPSYKLRVEKENFNFSCAHFLIFADGSREPLHGHNYWVWVEVEGELGPGHYLLDYITFKPLVKQACDELDHKTILPAHSPVLKVWKEGKQVLAEHKDGSRFAFPVQDTLVMDCPNTSTEILATHLARRIYDALVKRAEHRNLSTITVGVEEAPGQQSSYIYRLPHAQGE
ncbi:MAG: 6-carboxytetrahydropterin synthase [Planctomycetes bacterium]|nr:6-carboxytetrahydropterin synthase [Planctomycetota bacterium]